VIWVYQQTANNARNSGRCCIKPVWNTVSRTIHANRIAMRALPASSKPDKLASAV
jgi:hypothetical protein